MITPESPEPALEPLRSGTLGTRLRFFRERKGWTREDLSSHARVCLSTIQAIETGRHDNPRIKTLARLALPLGTCVGGLTEAKEETGNGR